LAPHDETDFSRSVQSLKAAIGSTITSQIERRFPAK